MKRKRKWKLNRKKYDGLTEFESYLTENYCKTAMLSVTLILELISEFK